MEERHDTAATAEPRSSSNEKILNELKVLFQRAEEKAIEQAKVADKVIRENPYPTIGIAFGLGLLLGIAFSRK